MSQEFLAIERFFLNTVAADSNDEYTCVLDGPGDYEDNVYWLECADIASSSTLSNGLYSTPLTQSDGSITQVSHLNYSSVNHFGGEFECEAAYSGERARVGDGVIDTFVSALRLDPLQLQTIN